MAVAGEVSILVVNVDDKAITAGARIGLTGRGTSDVSHPTCSGSQNCAEPSVIIAIMAGVIPALLGI